MINILSDFKFVGASDVIFFAKPELLNKCVESHKDALEDMKNNKQIDFGPEYFIIENIQKLNIKTLFIEFNIDKAFTILRNQGAVPPKGKIKFIIKQLIYIKAKKNYFHLSLLNFIPIIFSITLNLLSIYKITLALGNVKP